MLRRWKNRFRRYIRRMPSRTYAFVGVLSGLLIVQACSRHVPPESACNFVQNQNSLRVSWENNLPVDIYFDNSTPLEYQDAIIKALNNWNQIGNNLIGKGFFRLRGGSPGAASPARDGYTKIYVLNDWEEDKPTEQARTTVYWTGTRIYEADIRINHKDFDFYVTDVPDYKKVHLESLLVHELGHVLGLAHTEVETSVMQSRLANGTERDQPGEMDLSSLSCEY